MLTHQWAGEIFADCNQFYFWDSGRTNQAPVDYTEEDVTDFKVPPGWYRVRSLHARLASVNGIDGEDHCSVLVWPALKRPVAVVKQFGSG